MAWLCHTCGESHESIPLSFAADVPDNYFRLSPDERELRGMLASDQCVVDQKEFYLRGLIEIPIRNSEEDTVFLWGVWASVLEEDYDLIAENWTTEGREHTSGPFKGRLANKLGQYIPSTGDLKLTIKVQPVGQRPLFFIDEESHPLAIAQRDGLTLRQARSLADAVLHGRIPEDMT